MRVGPSSPSAMISTTRSGSSFDSSGIGGTTNPSWHLVRSVGERHQNLDRTAQTQLEALSHLRHCDRECPILADCGRTEAEVLSDVRHAMCGTCGCRKSHPPP